MNRTQIVKWAWVPAPGKVPWGFCPWGCKLVYCSAIGQHTIKDGQVGPLSVVLQQDNAMLGFRGTLLPMDKGTLKALPNKSKQNRMGMATADGTEHAFIQETFIVAVVYRE
jgi:hypothetical protein